MDVNQVITPGLRKLREAFVTHGHDLRFVGGCVRDLARGVAPKDIDLCTDADPLEQMAVYKAAKVSFYETGLAHGTLSARVDGETYEITSLRTETDHDGRHAVVSYTKDWLDDLGRRDLTFNAMALTFDGVLIDPFNGLEDLNNGVVRFVGNPDDRMREDYLRILRWLRFHGRFAPDRPLDPETVEAAQRQAAGLSGISRERVWMEFAKIIAGEGAVGLIDSMYDLGIAGPIGLPLGNIDDLKQCREDTRNPVSLTFALVNGAVDKLSLDWKWSSEERDLALFLMRFADAPNADRDDYKRLLAYDGFRRDWVLELARLTHPRIVKFVETYEIPVFPVKGQDLLDGGMRPGKEVGFTLKGMKVRWMESDYTLTKEALLSND